MTEPTKTCPICRLDRDETKHSCPFDRSEWKIDSLVLGPEAHIGKVVTPDGEFIVQWEAGLVVLSDPKDIQLVPVCGNAIEISLKDREDD